MADKNNFYSVRRNFVRPHFLEYGHQDYPKGQHRDSDELRDRQTIEFKRVVITNKLHKESCYGIKYEHQGKCLAWFVEKLAGVL